MIIELLSALSRWSRDTAVTLLDLVASLVPDPDVMGPLSDFDIDWDHVGTDDMWGTWAKELDLCQRARA